MQTTLQKRLIDALQDSYQRRIAVRTTTDLLPEKQATQRRCHRQRNNKRCENRNDVCDTKGLEEAALKSAKEEQRYEHHANDDGREHDR